METFRKVLAAVLMGAVSGFVVAVLLIAVVGLAMLVF